MDFQTRPNNAGTVARVAGSAFAIFGLFMLFMQMSGSAEPNLISWACLAVGFGLIVVGYLQKIAAK